MSYKQHFSKDELDEFIAARAELFDGPHQSNPFATSAWLRCWLRGVASPAWRYYALEADDAVMLLKAEDESGRHLSALTNYYASQFSGVISGRDNAATGVAGIVDRLRSQRPRVSSVTLAPLYRSSPETDVLMARLAGGTWRVYPFATSGNWYLPTAALDFERYMEQRPANLRNTWTRKLKKFASAGGRVEVIANPEDATRAIDAYQQVYTKSWKQPEPHPEFVPLWARACATNGWARFGIAWLGDTPIAAQFWFVFDGRAYIFKLAYDEEHQKLSAGTILTARLMEHVLTIDRVREVDFGTGDDPYKKTWMSHRRERLGLRAVNLSTVSGIVAGLVQAGGNLKRRLQLQHLPEAAASPAAAD